MGCSDPWGDAREHEHEAYLKSRKRNERLDRIPLRVITVGDLRFLLRIMLMNNLSKEEQETLDNLYLKIGWRKDA